MQEQLESIDMANLPPVCSYVRVRSQFFNLYSFLSSARIRVRKSSRSSLLLPLLVKLASGQHVETRAVNLARVANRAHFK